MIKPTPETSDRMLYSCAEADCGTQVQCSTRAITAYAVHGAEEREVGLLDPNTWRTVFESTRDGDLRMRFESRGIAFSR